MIKLSNNGMLHIYGYKKTVTEQGYACTSSSKICEVNFKDIFFSDKVDIEYKIINRF